MSWDASAAAQKRLQELTPVKVNTVGRCCHGRGEREKKHQAAFDQKVWAATRFAEAVGGREARFRCDCVVTSIRRRCIEVEYEGMKAFIVAPICRVTAEQRPEPFLRW